MEYKIWLNSIDEVVRLVEKLEKFDCEAYARMDDAVINARSMMGLIGLGIGKRIHLQIYRGFRPCIGKEIEPFACNAQ